MARAPDWVPLSNFSDKIKNKGDVGIPRKAPASVSTPDGGTRTLSNFELLLERLLKQKKDGYSLPKGGIDPKTGERRMAGPGGTRMEVPGSRARGLTELLFSLAQSGDGESLAQLVKEFKSLPADQKASIAESIAREFPKANREELGGWSPMAAEVMGLLQGGKPDRARLAALDAVKGSESGRVTYEKTQVPGEQDARVMPAEPDDSPVVETAPENNLQEGVPPGDFAYKQGDPERMPPVEGVDTKGLRGAGASTFKATPYMRLPGETVDGGDPAKIVFDNQSYQPTISPEETRQWLEERVRQLPGAGEVDLSVLGDDVLKTLLRKNNISDTPPMPPQAVRKVPRRVLEQTGEDKGTFGPFDNGAVHAGRKYENAWDSWGQEAQAAMTAAFGDVDELVASIRAAKESGDTKRLNEILNRVTETLNGVKKPTVRKPTPLTNNQRATNSLKSEQDVVDNLIIQMIENPGVGRGNLDRLWDMMQVKPEGGQKKLSPSDYGSGFSSDPNVGPRQFAEYVLNRVLSPDKAPAQGSDYYRMAAAGLEELARERFSAKGSGPVPAKELAEVRKQLGPNDALDEAQNSSRSTDSRSLSDDAEIGSLERIDREAAATPAVENATANSDKFKGSEGREVFKGGKEGIREWALYRTQNGKVVYRDPKTGDVVAEPIRTSGSFPTKPSRIAELRNLAYQSMASKLPSDTNGKKARAIARFNVLWPEGGSPSAEYFRDLTKRADHPEIVSSVRDGEPAVSPDFEANPEDIARSKEELDAYKTEQARQSKAKKLTTDHADEGAWKSRYKAAPNAKVERYGPQSEAEIREYDTKQKEMLAEEERALGNRSVTAAKPGGYVTRPDGEVVPSRYQLESDGKQSAPAKTEGAAAADEAEDFQLGGLEAEDELPLAKFETILGNKDATPEELVWAKAQYREAKDAYDAITDPDHRAAFKAEVMDKLDAAVASGPHKKGKPEAATAQPAPQPAPQATTTPQPKPQAKPQTQQAAATTAAKPKGQAKPKPQPKAKPQQAAAQKGPAPQAGKKTPADVDAVNEKLDQAAKSNVGESDAPVVGKNDPDPAKTDNKTDVDAESKVGKDGKPKKKSLTERIKGYIPSKKKALIGGGLLLGAGAAYQIANNLTQPEYEDPFARGETETGTGPEGRRDIGDFPASGSSEDRLRQLKALIDGSQKAQKIPQTMSRWH